MLNLKLGRDLANISFGDELSSIQDSVRYAIFHGTQGQFTPASKLRERLCRTISRKFAGRAALSMLTEGLENYAIPLGEVFKKRPGATFRSAEAAEAHALKVIGLKSRMDALNKSLAEKKLKL